MKSNTMSWKENNKTYQILKAAEEGKYGVVAAVAYNIEHIVAYVQAAQEKQSPFIIQVFPWAIQATDSLLIEAAALAIRKASVPIALHLDHAHDEDVIRYAADHLPFDSIMIDMSQYDDDRVNLQKTTELVAYCHARHITTEAEPGHIDGGDDCIADPMALEAVNTRIEQVDDFLRTGVDFLAPAIGNLHGDYGPEGVSLDFNCLYKIHKRVQGHDVRLVMHGTNEFPEATTQQCIAGGVSKINANKLVLEDYLTLQKERARMLPMTERVDQGIASTKRLVARQIDVCGSAGKAGKKSE